MENNKKKRDVLFKIIATMLITIILIHVNANIVNALSFDWLNKEELSIQEIK